MISIIIPVYNAAIYLDKCISSIINQSYTDWECILINDGSTDDSGIICNKWQRVDYRIKVIHQNNSGVSIARNNGIFASQGEYICFVDSDDWIEKNYLETMVYHFHECDIVISGQIRNYTEGNTIVYIPNKTERFSLSPTNIDLFVDLNRHLLLYAPHEKLYRTNIIKQNNLLFKEHCNYGEDLIFNFQYLNFVKNIVTVNCALYHYRISPNTLSSKIRNNQFNEDYVQWQILYNFYLNHNLLNPNALSYLYERLWGIIYNGIFLYPKLNLIPPNYIKSILQIKEIKKLKQYRKYFKCSKWIKWAILSRNHHIFNFYFYINQKIICQQ